MSTNGVFAVARSIWDDGDFADEPYTERQAFIWLVGAAVWKEQTVQCKNGRSCGSITLQRAEFCFSERFLATKWKWSNSRVNRFLDKLEQRGILQSANRSADGAQTGAQTRIYSVRNYNKFQVIGLPDRSANRAQPETQTERRRNKETVSRETIVSLGGYGLRPADSHPVQEAFDAYNAIARELELPVAKKLTTDRRRKLLARLNEHTLKGWNAGLDQLRSAPNLIGFAESGWRADLDFLLRPDKLNRLIEGGYAARPSRSPPGGNLNGGNGASGPPRGKRTAMQIAMDEVRRVQERKCEQREGHSDTIIDITPGAR
jgi:hypothetical protein